MLLIGRREGYLHAPGRAFRIAAVESEPDTQIVSGPIAYEVDGRQYGTAISGLSLCVFGRREQL